MDIHKKITIGTYESRNSKRTSNGEGEFKLSTTESARIKRTIVRVQGCLHQHITYKDLKGIPLKLDQHRIELDTTIPLAYQAKYKLNPNYAMAVKHDIDKLLVVGFI